MHLFFSGIPSKPTHRFASSLIPPPKWIILPFNDPRNQPNQPHNWVVISSPTNPLNNRSRAPWFTSQWKSLALLSRHLLGKRCSGHQADKDDLPTSRSLSRSGSLTFRGREVFGCGFEKGSKGKGFDKRLFLFLNLGFIEIYIYTYHM